MNIPDNISQEELERIESFLLKSMRKSEQAAFKREMIENRELSSKVHAVEDMLNGIEEAAFRENLEVTHREWKEGAETNKKRNKLWVPYSIAASVLLLLGIFSWIFFLRPGTSEQLFASYYQPDPGLVTAMGSSLEYAFDRGMVDYKTGEYATAIQRWENLYLEKPTSDTLNYFMGTAHLGLKNKVAAESYLEKVVEMEGSRFREDAYWYLALTNILNQDFEQAILNLEKSNHPEKDKLIKNIQEK